MDINDIVQAFVSLKDDINANIDTPLYQNVFAKAELQNPWFTKQQCRCAVNSFTPWFERPLLNSLTKEYGIRGLKDKKILVICAGNIPAVAFHDIVCVLLAGCKVAVKLSSSDSVIIPFLLQRLCCFCNELQSRIELTDDKNRLKDLHFDAVTATGSNSSALYFEKYFANVPHIIRKSRTSVAVLDNQTDITGIEDDICLYFGLGCRNISCLFVPEDYDFTKIKQRLEKYSYYLDHHKYRNNYDYQQAVMIMNNIPFIQAGCMLLRQSTEIFSPVSVLNYICYESKEHLHAMLKTQQDNLQCTANAFGKMQQPAFTQYADGVDTMRWLMNV